jgi:hypothetical protein
VVGVQDSERQLGIAFVLCREAKMLRSDTLFKTAQAELTRRVRYLLKAASDELSGSEVAEPSFRQKLRPFLSVFALERDFIEGENSSI